MPADFQFVFVVQLSPLVLLYKAMSASRSDWGIAALATPANNINNATSFFIFNPLFRLLEPAQAKNRHRTAEDESAFIYDTVAL